MLKKHTEESDVSQWLQIADENPKVLAKKRKEAGLVLINKSNERYNYNVLAANKLTDCIVL